MAIGNSVNYSIPVVGTTVGAFDRIDTKTFYEDYTAATGSFPASMVIRPAQSLSTTKRLGVTFKVRPSDFDNPGTVTQGSASVSINIDAVPGSIMTKAEIAEFTRYALSAMLSSTLIESLYDGATS